MYFLPCAVGMTTGNVFLDRHSGILHGGKIDYMEHLQYVAGCVTGINGANVFSLHNGKGPASMFLLGRGGSLHQLDNGGIPHRNSHIIQMHHCGVTLLLANNATVAEGRTTTATSTKKSISFLRAAATTESILCGSGAESNKRSVIE